MSDPMNTPPSPWRDWPLDREIVISRVIDALLSFPAIVLAIGVTGSPLDLPEVLNEPAVLRCRAGALVLRGDVLNTDDLRVFVGSKRAGERIMRSLVKLFGKLRLKVNEAKSAVGDIVKSCGSGGGLIRRRPSACRGCCRCVRPVRRRRRGRRPGRAGGVESRSIGAIAAAPSRAA